MTWTIKCEKCGADLGGLEKKVASICIRPMRNQETRSYFLCKECDVYSVWVCIEDFYTNRDTFFVSGPIPREKGDKIIDKIRKCSDPDNVSCSCPIHKELGPFTYY